jgi:adenylate cyclase
MAKDSAHVSKNKNGQWVFSIKFCILAICIGLFIAGRTSQVIVTSYIFEKTLTDTSFRLIDSFSSHISDVIKTSLNPVLIETQFPAILIKRGLLDPNNSDLMNYMFHLVKKSPIIEGALWGDKQGNFIYAEENYNKNGKVIMEVIDRRKQPPEGSDFEYSEDGTIVNRKYLTDLSYDPRLRPWYLQGENAHETSWTNVYLYPKTSMYFISCVTPVYDKKNKFLGVFALDVRLDNLQRFIENYKISKNGMIYFVNNKGDLLVFPKIKNNVIEPKARLRNLSDFTMPWLVKSLQYYNKTGQQRFKLNYNGETYLFSYKPLPFLNEYGWYVVVVVPRSDFTRDLELLHSISLGTNFLTFSLAIMLLLILVNRFVKPIRYLVRETEKIKNFDLDDEIKIHSRIKEVLSLRDAIISMKSGLRAFQKYVPKSLVKKLIETNEDTRVGGVKKPLAIFFSDIRNFATIAEMMDPDLLMIHLDEYFEHLSYIITEAHGTIDKYIGDSMMAFWGAPYAFEKPVYYAALAAIRCQKKLIELNKSWSKQGKPVLLTRIGIHFGDAIVGNLGSSERFNYTAIGDVVNTANRLEALNKNYGTKIIVSHEVYQLIKDDFILCMIDWVTVRGKMNSGRIYELIAEKGDVLTFNVARYCEIFQKGFDAYTKQNWDSAISLFEECSDIYPEDSVAPIFVARCNHFKLNPPPETWDGVWRISGGY